MSILDFFGQRKARLDDLTKQREDGRKAKGRIRPKSRISEVLDARSAVALFEDIKASNPLDFPGYSEKLADLQRRSGKPDAFNCAEGTIEGQRVVCAELVCEVLMGSMGTAVGEAICRSAEHALEHNLPLITFAASGGARMQEGMFSLMQMAKTSAAIRRFSDAGGLYISVLTHPTTGGVTASFASLGDIILAEPKALIGFAGPRVIEQTIGSTLPEGFQRSEFQLAHGFVDAIVPRSNMRETLAHLLSLHQKKAAVSSAPQGNTDSNNNNNETTGVPLLNEEPAGLDIAIQNAITLEANRAAKTSNPLTPAQHVEIARNAARPHAKAFIGQLFEGFIELHGDRSFADDRALLCGLAKFEGIPVTVAAHLKGTDLTENIACNFGMPHPEGYRKFIRLIKQAEKFNRPIVTFIDTPGAYPGAQAEERGQGEAIARCLFELSGLKVPVIAIITGEGGSGGALALGVADQVFMYEYAVYSVLSPEGFASILWKDAKRSGEACDVMKLTAQDLLGFEMIDTIIAEPEGGAHNDPQLAIETLRPYVHKALKNLSTIDEDTLLETRFKRYRKFS